jgi:hypothetical protein
MLNRRSALCSLALAATAALGWMGCESQKQTELVAGISTQVQVPRDLKTVQVSVTVEGAVTFCKNYLVYDGKVQLPRSLGALPRSAAGTPVIIAVTGFTAADTDDPATQAGQIAQSPGYGCQIPASVGNNLGNGGGARVLRVSRQPYSPNQILFVPMPLKFSCYDVACGNSSGDKTCKAGRCVDATTQVSSLSEYSDSLLFGADGTCFTLDGCFNDQVTVPPLTVDDAQCIYALPGAVGGPALPDGVTAPTPPAGVTLPADGLNVRVTFDSGLGTEILDLDKDEGFFIPNAATPQIFQLSPGLCDLVHGNTGNPHRLTAIEVNPVCRPKLPSQSICAADQLKIMGANPDGTVPNAPAGTCSTEALAPVKAAVEFVVDPTAHAKDFYSAAGALIPKLSDPGLKNLYVGVQFIPDGTASCPATSTLAAQNKAATLTGQLASYITGLGGLGAAVSSNNNTSLNVESALTAAYADLNALGSAVVNKSVIVVTANGLLQSCGGQTPAQVIAAHNASVVTSVVEINASGVGGCADPTLSATVGTDNCITKSGVTAQQAILKDLTAAAACTYSFTTAAAPDAVWFSDPKTPGSTSVVVPAATGTTAASCHAGGSGFVVSGKNLIFCKASCDAYQAALGSATALASSGSSGADGGAGSSSTKLPTIIPVFGMTGTACVAPKATTAGGSSGSTSDAGAAKDASTDGAAAADAGMSAACGPAGYLPTNSCTGASGDEVGVGWSCADGFIYGVNCLWPNGSPASTGCQCLKGGSLGSLSIVQTVVPALFPANGMSCSTGIATNQFDTAQIRTACGNFPAPSVP